MAERTTMMIPTRVGEAAEINYGKPAAPDFGPLARDRVPVRAMKESDLAAMIAIDRQMTGRDRSEYFKRKFEEALFESDVRVSLVADTMDCTIPCACHTGVGIMSPVLGSISSAVICPFHWTVV